MSKEWRIWNQCRKVGMVVVMDIVGRRARFCAALSLVTRKRTVDMFCIDEATGDQIIDIYYNKKAT